MHLAFFDLVHKIILYIQLYHLMIVYWFVCNIKGHSVNCHQKNHLVQGL